MFWQRLPHTSMLLQIAELRAEFQAENEDLLDSIRQLSKEIQFKMLIINQYIPTEYQVCGYVLVCVCT